MKKLNVLYVAGLFDGEGSCGYWSSGKGRSRKQTAQIKMTHKDIANFLGVKGETISRAIHSLTTKGTIIMKNKTMAIVDMQLLKDIIRPA